MTTEQRSMFQFEYSRVAKSKTTAVVLTLLLGGVGAHRFYLGQIGKGVLYALFFWTLIPGLVALFELFVISKRVDLYNAERAREIARQVQGAAL